MALIGVLLVAGLAVSPSSAFAGSRSDPSDAVGAARSTLQQAQRERVAADERLAQIRQRKAQVEARLAELDRSDAALMTDLTDARRQVREFAVAAFIDGGRTEIMRASLSPEQAAALSWRTGLVSGQAGSASDAAQRFDALRAANDPTRVAAAEQLDGVNNDEAQALSDVMQASALERDAEVALASAAQQLAAQRSAAQRAAARVRADQVAAAEAVAVAAVSATGPRPTPRPATRSARTAGPATTSTGGTVGGAPVGDATPDEIAFLAQVRRCESNGDYAIVSASGRYRGAYQFSVQTWQGVGGSGDPAAASPAEQDMRALKLLRMQGKRAWPVCSR